jgi:hypothetical protein
MGTRTGASPGLGPDRGDGASSKLETWAFRAPPRGVSCRSVNSTAGPASSWRRKEIDFFLFRRVGGAADDVGAGAAAATVCAGGCPGAGIDGARCAGATARGLAARCGVGGRERGLVVAAAAAATVRGVVALSRVSCFRSSFMRSCVLPPAAAAAVLPAATLPPLPTRRVGVGARRGRTTAADAFARTGEWSCTRAAGRPAPLPAPAPAPAPPSPPTVAVACTLTRGQEITRTPGYLRERTRGGGRVAQRRWRGTGAQPLSLLHSALGRAQAGHRVSQLLAVARALRPLHTRGRLQPPGWRGCPTHLGLLGHGGDGGGGGWRRRPVGAAAGWRAQLYQRRRRRLARILRTHPGVDRAHALSLRFRRRGHQPWYAESAVVRGRMWAGAPRQNLRCWLALHCARQRTRARGRNPL